MQKLLGHYNALKVLAEEKSAQACSKPCTA